MGLAWNGCPGQKSKLLLAPPRRPERCCRSPPIPTKPDPLCPTPNTFRPLPHHRSAPLWTSLLPGCGDVATQIDLMEALYRCAKLAALRPEHRAMLRADWAAQVGCTKAQEAGAVGEGLHKVIARRLIVIQEHALGHTAAAWRRGEGCSGWLHGAAVYCPHHPTNRGHPAG